MRAFPTTLILAALLLNAPPGVQAATPASAQGFDALGQSSLNVDQIELTGVTAFSSEEVQAALEVSPGDRLERVKVVRSAENLQTLYKLHGYERVGIRSQLQHRAGKQGASEYVLEFAIEEGDPTRIGEVRFAPETSMSGSLARYWESLESSLNSALGIQSGDLFDQARISASKRTLQDILASEEFIGAKINEVRVTEMQGPADGAPAARWVRLEFPVDLGDRVTFGFRGNTVFSSTQLQLLVDEQRLVGFGKDYVGAIRTRLEEHYRASGYAQVTIRPYTFERRTRQERHVTYFINEGPRVTVRSVSFDGNAAFSSQELLDRFNGKASALVGRGYYIQSEIQKAAELAVEWMKSRGYLAAKLVTVNTIPTAPNAVRVVIYVYEGEQTLVRDIRITGNTLLTSAEIREQLKIASGEPLNLFEFSEALENLKSMYRLRGYLAVQIEDENSNQVVRYSQENRIADVALSIQEGPQYRVGAIEISGLSRTKKEVVTRQLPFKVGDVLGEGEIFDSEARLRRLGIFSNVSIRTPDDPANSEQKRVQISVTEGTPGVWALGLGYRNDIGPRAFAQVGYSNVGGYNHTLSLTASANRRLQDFRFVEGEIQLGYLWSSFFSDDITFRPTLTYNSTQFSEFDAHTAALTLSWEKPLLGPSLTGVLSWNLERIRQFNATKIEIDNMDVQLASLGGTLRLDLRDDPLNPTSGLFAQGTADLTSPALGAQEDPYPVGFVRVQMRTDYHLKLAPGATWLFSFRSGFARNNEAPIEGITRSGMIPSIKTFALGGTSSLRGFKEQQLNVYETAIKGSVAFTNYRTQIDLPVSGGLRFGPFLDAASLFTDPFGSEEIRNSPDRVPFRWRYGAGLGLRYQTPVGSVNLDWAYNLKPELMKPEPGKDAEMEDRWILHFSIGVI